MRVPSVRRGSDRPSVGATDRKVLRDGDFWLWLRVIVTTKHSKTSDKSITIFFQTTKYFHRNTIHIDGVIVKVANRHGVASSLQQQPTRSLHRWRGRRAAHLAYDACPVAPPQLVPGFGFSYRPFEQLHRLLMPLRRHARSFLRSRLREYDLCH